MAAATHRPSDGEPSADAARSLLNSSEGAGADVSACVEQTVRSHSRDSGNSAGGPVAQKFQPQQVLEELENATKWQDRCRVLEDFHKSLLCIPVTESRPHMSEVLLILSKLLTDTNFKITLTTLYIIGDLVDRWSSGMMAVVGAVVPGLIEKLGDNKIVIRQTASKTFHKIFTAVVRMRSPQYAEKLLQSLTSSLGQRSVHLRLELLSVAVMALLVFENGGVPYDREQVLQVMCQFAQDPSEKVSAVAMEALAVLVSGGVATEDRIAAHLQGDQATQMAVFLRLRHGTLPSVTDEGLVEYPARGEEEEERKQGVMATGAGQFPAAPLRLPNAAMAVGRLGRKMFCLEQDASPAARVLESPGSRGSLSSATSSKRAPGPASASLLRRPGTTSADDRELPYHNQRPVGRMLQQSASSSELDKADRRRSSYELERFDRFSADFGLQRNLESPVGPCLQQTRSEGPRSGLRSPPTSAMKDRRRLVVQPLRVCFKDDLDDDLPRSPQSLPGSAHKLGCHSEWDDAFDRASPSGHASRAQSGEESGYIPNWQLRPKLEARQNSAALPSICFQMEEDTESKEEPRPDELFQKSEQLQRALGERPKCAGTMGFVEPEDKAQADIADKLRLLRRPGPGGRSRSQGYYRPFAGRSPCSAPHPHDEINPYEEDGLTRDIATPSRAVGARRVGASCSTGKGTTRSASAGSMRGSGDPYSQRRSVRELRELPPSPSAMQNRRVNSRTGAGGLASPGEGGVQYLSSEELPPFDALPSERSLDELFRRIGTPSDWLSQFEALTDLRRITRFAPKLLDVSHNLRQAVACVVSQVESLRSAVAKAALMCLQDIFREYKRGTDAELEVAAPVCIKKAADTNGLLVDEAERTLLAMCQSVSEAKGLATMLSLAAGLPKNAKVRAKSVWCLFTIVQRFGARIFRAGEVDRLLQLLHRLLNDASSEVRSLARSATAALHTAAPEEFEGLLRRCLSSTDVLKMKQMLVTSPSASDFLRAA